MDEIKALLLIHFHREKRLLLIRSSAMYRAAYSQNGNIVFYLDSTGNKYAAIGGSLAWRLNNPGLVRSASRFFFRQGAIGHFGHYAIFSTPENGREALSNWLCTKKYFKGSLKTIAKHYQPDNVDGFANRLSSLIGIPVLTKVKALSRQEFSRLLFGIEKLCDYTLKGNEEFYFMPKILGKIEDGKREDAYLIGGNLVLSKEEVVKWVQQNRLDAVIVHEHNGNIYIRSRPNYWIQHIRFPFVKAHEPQDIASFMRIVGTARPGQCIWAFINGIDNTKEDALKAANNISSMAGGERVLLMQNDTKGFKGSVDFGDCILLKASIELPVIDRAIKFLRYLLALEKEEGSPIILFAHSQGGIILEHALEFLGSAEGSHLRIFTFGGGSFISSGKSHPDSHNYASVADYVCLMGSPTLQTLALQRYHAHKEGLTDAQMIREWAFRDAILELDSIDSNVIKKFAEVKIKHYEDMFARIKNLSLLDPDPDSRWKHEFASDCYQNVVRQIIKKYHK